MGSMLLGDPELLRFRKFSASPVSVAQAPCESDACQEDSRGSIASRGTDGSDCIFPVFGLPTLLPRTAIAKSTRGVLSQGAARSATFGYPASVSSGGRSSRADSDSSSTTSDARDGGALGAWQRQASHAFRRPHGQAQAGTGEQHPGKIVRSAAVYPTGGQIPLPLDADSRRKRPRSATGGSGLFRGNSSVVSDQDSMSSHTSASLGGRALFLVPPSQPGIAAQFGPAGVMLPCRPDAVPLAAAGGGAAAGGHFRGDTEPGVYHSGMGRSASSGSFSSYQSGQRQKAVRVNDAAWPSSTDWHMYVFGGRGSLNRPVQTVLRLSIPSGPSEQLQNRPYCLALPVGREEELTECSFRETSNARWEEVATMPDSTVGIMATRCSRGIFVGGGSRPDVDKPVPSASVLRNDGNGHSWMTLPELPEGLRHSQAVFIPDADVVQVLGGRSSSLDGSALGVTNKVRTLSMHHSRGQWVESTPCPQARFAFGATHATQLGATIVAGGIDHGGQVQANTWLWDPRMPEWDTKDSLRLQMPRAHFRMVYNGGYGIYAVGGESASGEGVKAVEFLDLRRPEKWQEVKSMPCSRRRAGVAMAPGGSALFVLGGQRTWRPNQSGCDALFVDADVWAKHVVPNMPQVRGDCVAVWAPTTSSVF